MVALCVCMNIISIYWTVRIPDLPPPSQDRQAISETSIHIDENPGCWLAVSSPGHLQGHRLLARYAKQPYHMPRYIKPCTRGRANGLFRLKVIVHSVTVTSQVDLVQMWMFHTALHNKGLGCRQIVSPRCVITNAFAPCNCRPAHTGWSISAACCYST